MAGSGLEKGGQAQASLHGWEGADPVQRGLPYRAPVCCKHCPSLRPWPVLPYPGGGVGEGGQPAPSTSFPHPSCRRKGGTILLLGPSTHHEESAISPKLFFAICHIKNSFFPFLLQRGISLTAAAAEKQGIAVAGLEGGGRRGGRLQGVSPVPFASSQPQRPPSVAAWATPLCLPPRRLAGCSLPSSLRWLQQHDPQQQPSAATQLIWA